MDEVIQQSRGGSSSTLRLRIRDAHARPRFGYLRISVRLRREGWPINRKRVRRLSSQARPCS